MGVPVRAGGACGRASSGREGEDVRERAKKAATIGPHTGSLHPRAREARSEAALAAAGAGRDQTSDLDTPTV